MISPSHKLKQTGGGSQILDSSPNQLEKTKFMIDRKSLDNANSQFRLRTRNSTAHHGSEGTV